MRKLLGLVAGATLAVFAGNANAEQAVSVAGSFLSAPNDAVPLRIGQKPGSGYGAEVGYQFGSGRLRWDAIGVYERYPISGVFAGATSAYNLFAGATYYLGDEEARFKPYVAAAFGLSHVRINVDTGFGTADSGATGFALRGAMGAETKFGPTVNAFAEARYRRFGALDFDHQRITLGSFVLAGGLRKAF